MIGHRQHSQGLDRDHGQRLFLTGHFINGIASYVGFYMYSNHFREGGGEGIVYRNEHLNSTHFTQNIFPDELTHISFFHDTHFIFDCDLSIRKITKYSYIYFIFTNIYTPRVLSSPTYFQN